MTAQKKTDFPLKYYYYEENLFSPRNMLWKNTVNEKDKTLLKKSMCSGLLPVMALVMSKELLIYFKLRINYFYHM